MQPGDADPWDLARFVQVQAGMHDAAVRELTAGRKTGHWIWYELPQLAGLGQSPMSVRYAISGLDEARAYLAHPVLGPRLVECCEALLAHAGHGAEEILGSIDARKVRSAMTLFHRADPGAAVFARVLDAFYGGTPDPRTDQLLGR